MLFPSKGCACDCFIFDKRRIRREHLCFEWQRVKRCLMHQGSQGGLYRVVLDKLMICCDVQGESSETCLVVRPQTNCICLTSLSCGAIMGWWLLPLAWWNGQISDFWEVRGCNLVGLWCASQLLIQFNHFNRIFPSKHKQSRLRFPIYNAKTLLSLCRNIIDNGVGGPEVSGCCLKTRVRNAHYT